MDLASTLFKIKINLFSFSNFYRMYNFGSLVEEKLNSPNYSLEDLLEEDEMMINEIKNGNPKLLNLYFK